jgi:hypothetical protein
LFSSDNSDNDEGIYPRGMSLEKATEILLAWPPVRPTHVQPHPAVLERRRDVILQNLKDRTIPVVALNVPHILVCCQSNWPQDIFYFLKELRRPDLQNPPIVILHPDEPTANEWGRVGIFQDVFFLKGSPIYELDLMRGGVLQAGLSTKHYYSQLLHFKFSSFIIFWIRFSSFILKEWNHPFVEINILIDDSLVLIH